MANRLARETSPYLLQHADNPVEWYPWGEEAFAVAQREDRPVLLSVGYSACHWCHVMAHESFEDETTAALMNELFVNIKVDREERPDVDSIYMQAIQAMTGSGGWPMTVFLTPEGVPFSGGTYFPPEDRHGLRGFQSVLRATSEAYRERRTDVDAAGARLQAALSAPRHRADAELDPGLLEGAVRTLVAQADMRDGGFGSGPKFPHTGALELLIRRHWATGDPWPWRVASLALDRMARGGIHDQVGGGFHRYSVDGRWAVPHFEKMLYDNGLLASVYLHAHQLTGEPRWRRVVEQTLDYLLREMRLPDGGFASSQDADTQEGEGRFFVWTREELATVLGTADGEAAARLLGVGERGNFEGAATVLSLPLPLEEVAESEGSSLDEVAARLDGIRARLLTARAGRAAPGRDDKVITSWNALALRALAEAGQVLERSDYLAAARGTADFLLESLVVDGIVQRTWKDGEAKITGFLEDVSYLADALLVLYEATGEPRYFTRAGELCGEIVERFRVEGDGLYDTTEGASLLLVRPHTLDDNPLPAGQSIAAHTFLRLAAFTGEERWRERALEVITPLAGAVPRAPLAIPNLAAAVDLAVAPPREVAIAGDRAAPETRALLAAVVGTFDPHRVLAWGSPEGVPLLRDRAPIGGRPAAYICERFACQAPVTDSEVLRRQLAGVVAGRGRNLAAH